MAVYLSSLCVFILFVFRPGGWLSFPYSLSAIVLRSNAEFLKYGQGLPGQCPPSMYTANACFLFPRNVNYLTVRLPLGCGLKKSYWGESLLHDWPPIRLMLLWP